MNKFCGCCDYLHAEIMYIVDGEKTYPMIIYVCTITDYIVKCYDRCSAITRLCSGLHDTILYGPQAMQRYY